MASPTKIDLGNKEQAISNARRLLRAGDYRSAIEQAREILDGDDRCAEAYRLLGIALRACGEISEASRAEAIAIRESALHPDLFQATLALADNRLDSAEKLLRKYLQDQPDDAGALRLLAEIGARLGRYDAAESLVGEALRVAPDFPAAQALLGRITAGRRAQEERGPSEFPRGSHLTAVAAADQYAEALELYERVVERFPDVPQNWVSYGHILRTVGRRDDAIASYRHAIDLQPDSGEAWWALADLKTPELGDRDIDQLTSIVESGRAANDDLPRLHFALGRALELAGRYEHAFRHYEKGNQLRSIEQPFDRAAVTRHVDASIRLFDEQFFHSREGSGFDAPDPIFVLGMPRAGSTLIEQILASHSQIEGTMELSDIPGIANWLANGKKAGFEDSGYLGKLSALPAAELLKLGKGYIWGTALRRQTSKPFFIDKMPNNWLHLGLILTILPNARIIDARRHPMACGLSIFRQHFATGQEFSYDLDDIGSFYADYVRMMDHFDRVAPRQVIRVIHEELIANPEAGIRHLLDRLGLPFDEACLNFHQNRRAVRTSSSEQVRRPISRDGVEQWRAFEPWLEPLRQALGPILDNYASGPRRV